MSDVILPAEEHGKNTDLAHRLIDVEPVDGAADGQNADPRQDVVSPVPRKGRLASRSAALRISITRCAAWSRASSVLSPKAR